MDPSPIQSPDDVAAPKTWRYPLASPAYRAAYQKYVATLRRVHGRREFAIEGLPAIVEYLHKLHIRNGLGRPITPNTLKAWRQRREFPAFAMRRRSGLMTTNLLVLAWLWAYPVWQKHKPYKGTLLKHR